MPNIRHILTSFMAGEISPMLYGRFDTQHYQFGLETCENFVPAPEGPLVKRMGFEFIRDADATATWLTPFRFSVTQEYVLEWGAAKLRFFTNDGRIETSPGVAYEVTTPYAAAQAPALSFQQSFDRLYLDHPSYPPASLTRTGAATFSYGASVFKDGPFTDQNTDEAVTVTVSATTGSGITVSASSAIFLAGHVGALFRIQAKDFSTIKAWEPGMKDVTIGDIVRNEGKAYQAATAGTTGQIPPTHEDGSEWDGQLRNDLLNNTGPYGVRWTFLHERFGIVKITAIGGGGASATADVLKALPGPLTSVGSWRWAHGAISAARGYPDHVVHAFGRQIHIKGFELLASVVGDYTSHKAFTSQGLLAADLAFRRTLDAENPPLWVLRDRQALVLGTASAELAVSAQNAQGAVSGDNIKADPQSYYGSEAVRPAQLGSEAIFVERGGRRLRSTNYAFSEDRYAAVDLTAAARHVTDGGVVQLATQRWPYTLLHAVRGDGQVVTHPITRADVKGFSRMVLGGAAEAISGVCITGADGRTDELWALVKRDTPSGERREIWKQATWRELGDDAREGFYVDGGVKVAASGGQTTFTGLTHLAGQAVAVLAGGGVVPGLTVSDAGVLTLPATSVPAAAYTLVVGLPFTARAVTLRPAPDTRNGNVQGLRQRLVKVVLRVLETVGIKAGAKGRDLYDQIDRPASAAMDAAIPLFSGDTLGEIDGETNREGQLVFESSDPLPAIVNAAIMTLEVKD
jgi:hypothetical protein